MQKLILCELDQASALREAFVLRNRMFRGNGRPLGRFTSFKSRRATADPSLRFRMTAEWGKDGSADDPVLVFRKCIGIGVGQMAVLIANPR